MEEKNRTKKTGLKNTLFTLTMCMLVLAIAVAVAVFSPDPSLLNDEDGYLDTDTKPPVITFIMPIENGELIKDYSATSLKFNSTLKQWEAHKAVDIKGEAGADVVAVCNGKIKKIENTHLLGNIVTIEHADGLVTVYASLGSDIPVKEGETIKQGDKIGTISTSAKGEINDGPHLHFEVLKDGIRISPHLYLNFGDK